MHTMLTEGPRQPLCPRVHFPVRVWTRSVLPLSWISLSAGGSVSPHSHLGRSCPFTRPGLVPASALWMSGHGTSLLNCASFTPNSVGRCCWNCWARRVPSLGQGRTPPCAWLVGSPQRRGEASSLLDTNFASVLQTFIPILLAFF